MMKPLNLVVIAMIAGVGAVANAQTIFNYDVPGGIYSQSFNHLNYNGLVEWSNYAALPGSGTTGWSVWRSGFAGISGSRDATIAAHYQINATHGNLVAGDFYSFGSIDSSDRSLGDVGTNATGDFLFVLALKNTTGGTLSDFTVKYDMEQWRKGGNTAAQSLIFDYKDLNTSVIRSTDTSADGVGFSSPGAKFDATTTVNPTTAGAVDGNSTGLVAARGGTITGLNWSSGDVLLLRWWDDNNVGNDHGLSIDNVTFSAVPEPATMTAMALGLAAMVRRRKASKA